jgi:hypothetical protein
VAEPLVGELLEPAHRPTLALVVALSRFRALEKNSLGPAQRQYCAEASAEIIATLELHDPEMLLLLRAQFPHLLGTTLIGCFTASDPRR